MSWAAAGVMTTVLLAAIGLLSFWVDRQLAEVGKRLDRIDARLDRFETEVLRGYGERIARLEERTSA